MPTECSTLIRFGSKVAKHKRTKKILTDVDYEEQIASAFQARNYGDPQEFMTHLTYYVPVAPSQWGTVVWYWQLEHWRHWSAIRQANIGGLEPLYALSCCHAPLYFRSIAWTTENILPTALIL